MENNTKNQLANITITLGALLFASSYWVDYKKTAVNRRYAGMIMAFGGLAFKTLK